MRVGITGFGFMGRMHYGCWKKVAGAEVVALCDKDKRQFEAPAAANGNVAGADASCDYGSAAVFEDFRRMLEEANPGLVDITLPTFLHVPMACEALARGIHVLCEKPMALTAADCDTLLAAWKAAPAGTELMIGHCLRFRNEYAYAKRLIESGAYGKVIAARFGRYSAAPGWTRDGGKSWFFDESLSGGVALDLHIHDTDMVHTRMKSTGLWTRSQGVRWSRSLHPKNPVTRYALWTRRRLRRGAERPCACERKGNEMETVEPKDLRVMIIGAHPDDPDITGGGLALKFVKAGATVKMVSMCNGDKGHMEMAPEALAARRYLEAQRSKAVLGVDEYRVIDHPDCELEATLDLRKQVTRIIRAFAPHLVFTHRICDYHADHRAVGTLVMDSAYLLGVPLWCPEAPVPAVKPAIYFLRDAFMHPAELRPDIVVDIGDEMDQLLTALCSHESQFFEWLVFDKRIAEPVPSSLEGRKAFIEKYWMIPRKAYDAQRFRARLEAVYGEERGRRIRYAEAYELSEYGYQPTADEVRQLFPFVPGCAADAAQGVPKR